MNHTPLFSFLALCGLAATADAGRLVAIDNARVIYEIDPAKHCLGSVLFALPGL